MWVSKVCKASLGFKDFLEFPEFLEFLEHKARRETQEMTECSPQKQRRPLQLP